MPKIQPSCHMTNPENPTLPLPELATRAQVARWAQISERSVRRLVHRNEIPFVRIGRLVRFPGERVRAALVGTHEEAAL